VRGTNKKGGGGHSPIWVSRKKKNGRKFVGEVHWGEKAGKLTGLFGSLGGFEPCRGKGEKNVGKGLRKRLGISCPLATSKKKTRERRGEECGWP